MLRLSACVLKETILTLARCGNARCECVVYWTGPKDEKSMVDGWEHPAHRRSPYGYQIEDDWLTAYWFRLASENRSIRAQIHTHPGEAFHSSTDDEWPIVSTEGFVSLVVPNFAQGSIDLDQIWTGILRNDGAWKHVPTVSILEVFNE